MRKTYGAVSDLYLSTSGEDCELLFVFAIFILAMVAICWTAGLAGSHLHCLRAGRSAGQNLAVQVADPLGRGGTGSSGSDGNIGSPTTCEMNHTRKR